MKKYRFQGRLNDPTCAARIKGPCGDEMEFYLAINDGRIEDIKFFTDGCNYTLDCAEVTAKLVFKKNIQEALSISPLQVKNMVNDLPQDHNHCSILAVSTLFRAIAYYLLSHSL